MLVQTCKLMYSMGLGIDPGICLDIVNAILSRRNVQKHFWPVCRGVVCCIIAANSDLLCLVRGNSIDPKRVRQADTEVRNSMFVKIENYFKFLHTQGKIPWESFVDMPAKNMSNMDKLAVNAYDHRKKSDRICHKVERDVQRRRTS